MHTLPALLSAVAVVFVVTAVGALARRVKWLTAEADASLIKLSVRLLFPALVLHTMTQTGSFGGAGGLFLPPVTGFALCVLGFGVAGFVAWLLRHREGFATRPQRATFVLCVGIFNYAYLPVPLVKQLFPDAATTMSTLFLFNVGVEITLWTVGLLILSGRLGKNVIGGILNPVVIAIGVAIVLALTGNDQTRWPAWLATALEMLAVSAIPVSLIVTGATVSDVWNVARFRDGKWTVIAAALLRLGVLPVLFLLAARAATGHGAADGDDLYRVIVVQAAMPSAIFPIVLSRHYGGDAATAVRVVIATSLLGLATIPLWLLVGLR